MDAKNNFDRYHIPTYSDGETDGPHRAPPNNDEIKKLYEDISRLHGSPRLKPVVRRGPVWTAKKINALYHLFGIIGVIILLGSTILGIYISYAFDSVPIFLGGILLGFIGMGLVFYIETIYSPELDTRLQGNIRMAENISKLVRGNLETRKKAALEASTSLSCWWEPAYYDMLLPFIFDKEPEIRKAVLVSFGDMISSDLQQFASPILSLPGFGPNLEEMKKHFSEGQKKWRESEYYKKIKKIVFYTEMLLEDETQEEVIAEARKTIDSVKASL